MMHDFLRKIPLLANLDEADFVRVSEIVEEVRLSAGQELFTEGSPGNRAYLVWEGQLEVVKTSGGREVLLAVRGPEEVIGEMSLLEERPRMASVRARTDCLLLAIPQKEFDDLLNTRPSATRAMLTTILERWRDTEVMLRQSEKMAQLGTLTAGVAHELNNPAAAVKRGTDHLGSAITRLERAYTRLHQFALTETQRQTLQELARQTEQQAQRPTNMDGLARDDRGHQVKTWLEDQGVAGAWQFAPALVDLGYDTDGLARLTEDFGLDQLPEVIDWMTADYTKARLLAEIDQGAARISEIVKALKSYTYLDQAPLKNVNVHEGLDSTLVVLQHKLESGISVRREYAPDLPGIQAYGGELNQVWTNIIDNAIDALEGTGEIVIRTHQDGPWIVVEIEDDGPGIPEEIQSKVFDPFFTTKPPGQGAGLGLQIAYNIVVLKHRGDIRLFSQPGTTRFEVRLPINFEVS